MSIIDTVLQDPDLIAEPPVLLDVGASGGVFPDWKSIAPYAVCIAFDPDQREMGYVERSSSGFKRLIVYNSILHDREVERAEFYLTRSPYCSSVLPPLTEKLGAWAFHRLFEVVEKTTMPAVTLGRVLAEQQLTRVDWFKSDSQGMDLRLFQSLGESNLRRVLMAQFEPGIIDAYGGEDSLASVLAFMQQRGFWMTDIAIHGSQRVGVAARGALPPVLARNVHHLVRTSPGWGELTYLNTFEGEWSRRDLLLGWVLATIRAQHGFALELAVKGTATHGGELFERLRRSSLRRLRTRLPVAAFQAALSVLRAVKHRLLS
jgi:hypothetical protein